MRQIAVFFFFISIAISNEDKKKILFIKNSFKKYSKQYLFPKKNFIKINLFVR